MNAPSCAPWGGHLTDMWRRPFVSAPLAWSNMPATAPAFRPGSRGNMCHCALMLAGSCWYPSQVSEGSHPCQHQLVAMPRCGKAMRSQHLVVGIDNSCNMEVFVCVNPTHDWDSLQRFRHGIILSGSFRHTSPERMLGQDSHETKWSGPSWVTRHLRDKASPQGVPGQSTGPGKDTCQVDRNEGQTKPENQAAPTQRTVDQCLSQTTRELVTII